MKLYNNDFWTLEDGLGIGNCGDYIAQMALEVPAPFTIGIIGKWGSGKTSILRRAFATLGGQPISQAVPLADAKTEMPKPDWDKWNHRRFESQNSQWDELHEVAEASFAVWYSPWQHPNVDNPMIPLLLEIKEQYSNWLKLKQTVMKRKFNRRDGMASLALIGSAIDAAANISGIYRGTLASGAIENVKKAWNEAAPAEPALSDGQRFHLLFEDAVSTLLDSVKKNQKQARLIIFIDDLDRCEESVIVTLLESIKLYLSTRHCVFVLGIDDNAVLKALKNHWSTRSDDDNREYLEKLFQANIPVPVPKTENIQIFIREQLSEHKVPLDPVKSVENSQEPATPLQHSIDHNLAALLEPNPRKIKNFINSLCAVWNLFQGRKSEPPALKEDASEEEQREHEAKKAAYRKFTHRFMVFHYLRLYHKPVWRLLERQR
ncbi:MAG: hypothetical protein GY862_33510, partial [Gammaproteobacteria bacterium]|nr:hypothetical protein [Gammaproteobacteria bacterium]